MTDPFPTERLFGPGAGDHARTLLNGVEVMVRCGLHPWERHVERPNRLLVDAEIWTDWPVRRPGDASPVAYVDYDMVRGHILSWRDRPHVDLLETLLTDLSDFILRDTAVAACRVRIVKPDIFPETREAGVEVFRRRSDTGA